MFFLWDRFHENHIFYVNNKDICPLYSFLPLTTTFCRSRVNFLNINKDISLLNNATYIVPPPPYNCILQI